MKRKRWLQKMLGVGLAIALVAGSTPAFADPTYTEYGIYVQKPASVAGDRFYHGAKFEPKTGSYLGIFAQGDRALNNDNAPAESGEWFLHTTERVLGRDHATYLLYINYDQGESLDHYASYMKEAKRIGAKGIQLGLEVANANAIQNDDNLRRQAKALQSYGIPIFLRFNSEFNLTDGSNGWQSWGPELYKEKFRIIADVMHQEAPNVVMCWCPNDWPIGSEVAWYPGDQYVDWVGVSSYPVFNADGTPQQGNTWMDRFREIYDRYGAKKPIFITEGAAMPNIEGTTDLSLKNVAAYEIQRFYAGAARRYPNLKMVVYWNHNEPGARMVHGVVTDVPELLQAYKTAVSDPYYLSNVGAGSSYYYEKVEKTTLSGKEKISSYVNDVHHRIDHVDYYVNGQYAAQAKFPSYEATIDFTPWQGQSIQLKADYWSEQGTLVTSKTVNVGGGNAGSSASSQTSSKQEIPVYYNGKRIQLAYQPIIWNNYTYLPVRFVGEAVHANVDWDNATRTVIAKRGNNTLKFHPDAVEFEKNGMKQVANTPVIIRENRAFVPLRSLAEGLDLSIQWNNGERAVYISEK
ncbi:MAG: stalk domain-containing protein [Clostridiales bacterium]|nr:hypothetical protein [Clostridiales bacterium]MDU1028765.1 stalk domain-containing protein [Clostridiales bacterium]